MGLWWQYRDEEVDFSELELSRQKALWVILPGGSVAMTL